MEELNLCNLLKNNIGDVFYSTIHGESRLIEIESGPFIYLAFMPTTGGLRFIVNSKGQYSPYKFGECIVFPAKDQRDWSKYEEKDQLIPRYSYVLVGDCITDLTLRQYLRGNTCYSTGIKEGMSDVPTEWRYIIPFEKFDKDLSSDELEKLSIV